MGYLFQKKSKREELRVYFSEKKEPYISTFVTLSLEILQNCVTPFGNSKVKNQDPQVFCKHTLKFQFCFNWPLEFSHPLFSITPEIPCHPAQPPSLGFFWNSPIHIFLQTHNLQRIIFRIFISHLKYKIDFKQSKKIAKLASVRSCHEAILSSSS